jgi:hypothetical protein
MAETRTIGAMEPGSRGGGLGQWFALAGAVVAVGVIVALVVSWPNGGSDTLSTSQTPPMPTGEAAGAASPAPRATTPAATAGAQPVVRVRSCEPIFGGGVPHQVTSSARRGAPAGCDEAHSVLLASLNRDSTGVGGWHCTQGPNGGTLEACTSGGGRRIAARD